MYRSFQCHIRTPPTIYVRVLSQARARICPAPPTNRPQQLSRSALPSYEPPHALALILAHSQDFTPLAAVEHLALFGGRPAADQPEDLALFDRAFALVLAHPKEAAAASAFLALPRPTLEALLAHDRLAVPSELVALELALRWLTRGSGVNGFGTAPAAAAAIAVGDSRPHPADRGPRPAEVLRHVRLACLSLDELFAHVSPIVESVRGAAAEAGALAGPNLLGDGGEFLESHYAQAVLTLAFPTWGMADQIVARYGPAPSPRSATLECNHAASATVGPSHTRTTSFGAERQKGQGFCVGDR